MLNSTKNTKIACFTGYVIQAVVNNLSPLLYAMFNTKLNVSLELLGILATVNFVIQIFVDLSSQLIEKLLGLRKAIMFSHFSSAMGLILLGILPPLLKSPFLGVFIATLFMAVGGGLSEVFLSPIIQAIPSDTKQMNMNILHSFYGLGQCAVVLVSTIYFALFSIDNWFYLPFVWAIIPLINLFVFIKVPLYSLPKENGIKKFSILKQPVFWLLLLMMVSAGASEIVIANWASAFAELGLNVDKALGDILGPCLFALFLALGRLTTVFTKKMKIEHCLLIYSFICIICYLIVVFAKNPIISLIGCALSGLAISVFWPSTLSLGAEKLKNGGTLMFSLFAFGGDIGCSIGAGLIGIIANLVKENNFNIFNAIIPSNGIEMRSGIFISLIFPAIMFLGSLIITLSSKEKRS